MVPNFYSLMERQRDVPRLKVSLIVLLCAVLLKSRIFDLSSQESGFLDRLSC